MDFDSNLPESVTLLTHPETNGKVYLVGTNHFSRASQKDVATVIRGIVPHMVVLELCSNRKHVLIMDEAAIIREATSINRKKMKEIIKKNGVINGMTYIFLLNMNAKMVRETGIAPGGEFRVAFREALRIPNCKILLGDRPIHITFQRAFAAISWSESIRIMWNIMHPKGHVTMAEIEDIGKSKEDVKDAIDLFSKEYPALGKVFVEERDVFLTHTLQAAASLKLRTREGKLLTLTEPPRVVGVVGMGHVAGIKRLWPIAQEPFIQSLLTIPPPSLSSKIIHFTFVVSTLTLGGYLTYQLIIKKIISRFKK